MKCLRHVGRKWLNLNSFKNTLGTCSLLVQYKQHFTSMGLGYSLLTPGLDMTHMLWWVMVMGTTKSKGQPAEKEADFYACTNFWNLVYYWTPGTDFATGYTFICAYKCRHSSCAHTCPFSGCQLQLAHASKHQVTSLRDPHQKNHNSEFLQKQNITSPPKKYPCKRMMCLPLDPYVCPWGTSKWLEPHQGLTAGAWPVIFMCQDCTYCYKNLRKLKHHPFFCYSKAI